MEISNELHTEDSGSCKLLVACFTWSSAWILIVDFHPQIFFSLFPSLATHKVSKSVTKSVSCHRKTKDKKSATKSVAKSVPLGQKIHRKIRHSHQKNPLQFHSTETCALQTVTTLMVRIARPKSLAIWHCRHSRRKHFIART